MAIKSDNLEAYSHIAASKIVPPLTNLLHSLATASGWPENITTELSLTISDDYEISVDYPEELATEIEDLEYGAFGGIPNAVIRPFISRSPSYIKGVLEEITVSRMMKDMGIL